MKRTALLMMVLAAGAAGAEDSPLVQAAKQTAARRKTATNVITNATVTRSTKTLSTSRGAAQIPDYTAKPTTPNTYAPAGGSATQIVVPTRPGTPAGGAYPQLAASDPRLPQPSQNAMGGAALGMAQNAGYGATTPRTVQSSAYAPPASSASPAVAPRTAANSSSGPAPSQNAGQNRDRRP
jgi:hypothetical protein